VQVEPRLRHDAAQVPPAVQTKPEQHPPLPVGSLLSHEPPLVEQQPAGVHCDGSQHAEAIPLLHAVPPETHSQPVATHFWPNVQHPVGSAAHGVPNRSMQYAAPLLPPLPPPLVPLLLPVPLLPPFPLLLPLPLPLLLLPLLPLPPLPLPPLLLPPPFLPPVNPS
jgi:hypothetical protein